VNWMVDNRVGRVGLLMGVGLAILWLGAAGPLHAGWSITQTIKLKKGWNAVFLELEPEVANPDELFKDMPVVDQVLTYYPIHSPVEFIQDPDEVAWKKAGWHRWVPPGTPEGFLKNLYSLQANQAYLIHCTEDHTWEVSGTAMFERQEWQPDSFNFIGFHVDPDRTPTFKQYYDGSKAHADAHIYCLKDNHWTREASLETEIKPAEAYWVYCRGGSDFMGPVDIRLPGSGTELRFLVTNPVLEISIVNASPGIRSFWLLPIPNASEADPSVPLSLEVPRIEGRPTYEPLGAAGIEFTTGPGEEKKVRLAVRREEITTDEAKSLLRISDDLGNRFYVPVWAEKLKIE